MTTSHVLTGLFISATLGITAVLITLWSATYVAVCRALDTHTDRRARRAARTRHAQTTAEANDTVTLALDSACCERWWTSCGYHHDPHCHTATQQ